MARGDTKAAMVEVASESVMLAALWAAQVAYLSPLALAVATAAFGLTETVTHGHGPGWLACFGVVELLTCAALAVRVYMHYQCETTL